MYVSQKVLLAQFSLFVHKRGLKPHLFHFISLYVSDLICTPVGSITVISVVLSGYRFVPVFVHSGLDFIIQSVACATHLRGTCNTLDDKWLLKMQMSYHF